MGRSVELELRKEVKEINEKVSNLQVSFTKETGEIKTAIATLKANQNTGVGIFKFIVTIVVASVSGLFGAHFSK